MPKSRVRKKKKNTPTTKTPAVNHDAIDNPPWLVPTMITLMVVGLIWVVVTYLWQSGGPIPGIGSWNLAIGFVLIMSGFLLTMRWR